MVRSESYRQNTQNNRLRTWGTCQNSRPQPKAWWRTEYVDMLWHLWSSPGTASPSWLPTAASHRRGSYWFDYEDFLHVPNLLQSEVTVIVLTEDPQLLTVPGEDKQGEKVIMFPGKGVELPVPECNEQMRIMPSKNQCLISVVLQLTKGIFGNRPRHNTWNFSAKPLWSGVQIWTFYVSVIIVPWNFAFQMAAWDLRIKNSNACTTEHCPK